MEKARFDSWGGQRAFPQVQRPLRQSHWNSFAAPDWYAFRPPLTPATARRALELFDGSTHGALAKHEHMSYSATGLT